jgi:hypothetical protein
MELITNLIIRDFPANSKPQKPRNPQTLQMLKELFEDFVMFDTFKPSSIQEENQIVLFDTCSLLAKIRNPFMTFNKNTTYIITCGVFLEILQGATVKTLSNGFFDNEIRKIYLAKKLLGENLVFLMLGRKRRAYWKGFNPSQSCKDTVKDDQPHFKILRDIDTELFRLSISLNWKIETEDFCLNRRIEKHKLF